MAGAVAVVVMSVSCVGSHAAVRLGQPGDVGHLLGRLLREQREQLLDRDAADESATRRRVAVSPCSAKSSRRKRMDLPVLRRSASMPIWAARAPAEVLVPLVVIGEEALVVDMDLVAVDAW